jgi:HAE1 family hydrophobic/amphiphilic exporter-1
MIKGAINRPVTVSMFILALSLFGYISLDRLALNLLPDISYPTLTIQTEYQDAAPEEVESLITRPIEEAVGVLPGLSRLNSVSRSGPAWKRARNWTLCSFHGMLDALSSCASTLPMTPS